MLNTEDNVRTIQGFHDGELAVQRQAGVEREAHRLEGMLDLPDLSGGAGRFLADRTFAALSARGADGRLWTTALRGPAGFLRASGRSLTVAAAPGLGDPLRELAVGGQVGMAAVEFAARRRVRVNGRLVAVRPDHLEIEVDQAYGNCPQYISPRTLVDAGGETGGAPGMRDDRLSAADRALIRGTDTFFIGTAHPSRGADVSHRGGPVGFLHVEGETVSWPDLPGNNMFNTLGNLASDPASSLLFVDWNVGDVLAVSGTAVVEWSDQTDDALGGTGRRVVFTTEAVVRRQDLSLRAVASGSAGTR